MARIAAVDIGNDAVKAIFDGGRTLYIPNVIASEDEEREVITLEKDILDGLHIKIFSGALSTGKGTYVVGNLATKYAENDELTINVRKATSDQALILLLTTLAVDAVRTFEDRNDVIEARYMLSTGLPLREVKQKLKKTLKDRLLEAHHEVTFLQTPTVEGKKVRISFEDVLVGTEGHAAMMDLAFYEDGSPRNEELLNTYVLINDIGGLSTDSAIIEPSGTVDNVNSEGLQQGVSPYLDEIIRHIEADHGKYFKSRRELVEVLTANGEDRYHIYVNGTRTPIKEKYVDPVLNKLAQEEYKHIQHMWEKVPRIRVSYQIGGGAVLLKDYLEAINHSPKGKQYPLRFVDPQDSVWMIARAYYKLARFEKAGV